jgi:hypothetical protein
MARTKILLFFPSLTTANGVAIVVVNATSALAVVANAAQKKLSSFVK